MFRTASITVVGRLRMSTRCCTLMFFHGDIDNSFGGIRTTDLLVDFNYVPSSQQASGLFFVVKFYACSKLTHFVQQPRLKVFFLQSLCTTATKKVLSETWERRACVWAHLEYVRMHLNFWLADFSTLQIKTPTTTLTCVRVSAWACL